jgi:hypothetical protein
MSTGLDPRKIAVVLPDVALPDLDESFHHQEPRDYLGRTAPTPSGATFPGPPDAAAASARRNRHSTRWLIGLTLVVTLLSSAAVVVRTTGAAPHATAQVTGPGRITIGWPAKHGATMVAITRDGYPVGSIPAAARTFTDSLLWPEHTYLYKITFRDATGDLLGTTSAAARTADGFPPRLYASGSIWNQPIGSSPAIDQMSTVYVQDALLTASTSANFANSSAWGVPAVGADSNTPLHQVACERYGCRTGLSARVPSSAVPSSGSDHRLVVLNTDTRQETDLWKASYDAATDRWSSGSRYQGSSRGSGVLCQAPERCGGAVAAGWMAMGGLIRPEEIASGHIDHALSLALPLTRSGVVACPATHTDGRSDSPGALPLGARVQLDPTVEVNATNWPQWEKVIARTLQKYGAYVSDTSESLLIRGESTVSRGYDAWQLAGVPEGPGLRRLPWDRMRVLEITGC